MILLTGSSGFLGKAILKEINHSKFETLSRSNATYNVNLKNEIPFFKNNYDLVIHCAGKAHSYPKNKFDIKDYYDINVKGTENLLLGLETDNLPSKFVFISSVAVYGMETGDLINETYDLNAKDPYGISKIQVEQMISRWCAKHGVICTIFRLPLIAGPNPPGNLGIMIKAIQKGYFFTIGGGKIRKSIVLADDIAKIIPAASKIGGIYNLTDGYHPSIKELGNCISKQLGKRIHNIPLIFSYFLAFIGTIFPFFPLNFFKLKKLNYQLTFDDSKARGTLKWKPRMVIESFKIK